jgi:hypothetical protein
MRGGAPPSSDAGSATLPLNFSLDKYASIAKTRGK